MDDSLTAELERLRDRTKRLAEDKSFYQLILRLMELLNPLPGLEDMLRGMLFNVVECIGGTNIKLYYWIGEELRYLDFYGESKHLDDIDDPAVAQAARTHEFVEQQGSTEEALLMHGMLRGSWTWTFPLLVGQELVGVIKLENLHIHGAALGRYLPIFCRHAALILSNEIRNVVRHRAEADLRVATERLRLATEAGLIGIWDWDILQDELVWDDAMYRLYGRQAGDFGGAYQAWLSAVHPEDKPLADGEIQAALRGEREYGPEFRVVWPDGSIHYLKAASITLRDAAGKPLRMVGINYDLTERKQAEAVQRRLNRELRAITDCNQALIRAADEATLLNDVCRIICDEAGYRMAWVGYAECDEAKSVRPVAWAGVDEGYLASADINWADTERGRGPTGTAVRTGHSDCIQDFATDPRALPWRDDALSRGYGSSIALPLKDEGANTFAALTIYSTEVNAFTPDEVRLMEELAGDLAFGVAALRARAERARAEEARRRSEAKYFAAFHASLDLIAITRASDGTIVEINDGYTRMLGYTRDESIGKTTNELSIWANSDDRARFRSSLRQAGLVIDFETQLRRKDGTVITVIDSARTLEIDGETCVLSVVRDITQRKRAEEESRAYLSFLEVLDRVNRAIQGTDDLDRMMSDVLDVVLATFDCDRTYLMYPCDPGAASWSVPMERNKPEYPGILALGHVVPMDPEVAGTLRLLLDSEAPVTFGPDTGHPVPAEVSERYGFKSFMAMAIRPKTGKPWQFGIHQCSRARRWTPEEARLFEEIGRRLSDGLGMQLGQRDLRESERKLAEAERVASVGYIDRDSVAKRVSLSAETSRILGLPLEQRTDDLDRWNELWLQRIHPDDRARIAAAYDEIWRNGRHYDQEYRVVRPDGEVRVVHSRADLMRDAEGQVVRMLGTMQDVTERKAAEAELENYRHHLEDIVAVRTRELAEARDAAEAANRAKSVFLSNMSHELRTPLNAILGFAQVMEADVRMPADQRSNLDVIARSGRHLLSLINDVLEISRIEAGRLKAQPVAFDLPELLDSLHEIMSVRAASKGLALKLSAAPRLPHYVVGDAGKLRQVLLNLLSNAVKYTDEGEIELAACAHAAGGQVQLAFSVRDTGVGIAAADLERIFQPFYQTDYGIAVGEGTGLGLTISREYAQLLGGSITVESTPGKGSTFRLEVPVTPLEAPPELLARRGRVIGLAEGHPPCRVLVVDDDADSQRLLALILEHADFRVRVAGNGVKAVEEFAAWHPDFIWMDMRMPVMDGYEATRRIRALPGGGAVKIVALTASAFREDRDQIIAAGCDDVLAKPFDEMQLFGLMEKLLSLPFRYAEADAKPSASAMPIDLARAPKEVRRSLRVAAQSLDVEATRQIIEQLRKTDEATAAQLEAWAKEYRYDRILSLCDESEGQTAG